MISDEHTEKAPEGFTFEVRLGTIVQSCLLSTPISTSCCSSFLDCKTIKAKNRVARGRRFDRFGRLAERMPLPVHALDIMRKCSITMTHRFIAHQPTCANRLGL